MSNYKKILLKHFSRLSEQDQNSLVAYAEFLANRDSSVGADSELIKEPLVIPRPEKESVIKAIKRLSATYPMLDRSVLLNEISNFMTQHIIHGEAAAQVIDKLQLEFESQYEKWQN